MIRVNDLSMNTLYYRRATDDQVRQIHEASLEILQEIGLRIQEPEALELLRHGGAVVDGSLVRIPSWRVDWALRRAPKQLTLFDQSGKPAIRLRGRVSYFGNGSDLLYIIDHRTGERRLAQLQDVVDTIRVLDALENIDFVMSGFLPRDVPVEKAELLQMQAMLEYTLKPIVYVVTCLENAKAVTEMCATVAGGVDAFRQRPFAACYINIANPLRHDADSVQELIWLSRQGLPLVYRPGVVTRGVSTPVSWAGFLAVQNASGLAGLVISQLVREGTPFVRDAASGGKFDMQYMVGQQAPPEVRGFNEELLHFYGLPGFGMGGNTGSKTIDSQAALEAALTLVTSTQAGAHLIHDVGYMDNGMTGSLEFLVICDEIIQWIKVYAQPLVVNSETLAMESIREVVATDDDFLGSDDTVKHFREDWYPALLDRRDYEGWYDDAATTMRERAKSRVEQILSQPAERRLQNGLVDAIQAIVDNDL